MALDEEKTDDEYSLRQDIHLLGELLGITLQEQVGKDFYEKVEHIRQLAKSARSGSEEAAEDEEKLKTFIHEQSNDDLLLLARAFGHFLNYANIAEAYQDVRKLEKDACGNVIDDLFQRLLAKNVVDADQLLQAVTDLDIELVFTAHPTEVKRRTLIQKLADVGKLLKKRDRVRPGTYLAEKIRTNLHALITSIWQTDEIRRVRPSPLEEAKWGMAVIEDTLWDAIPFYYRNLDRALHAYIGKRLPLDAVPIHFGSWMGGDRDGNPNVTAKVTEEVCLLSRWMAVDLYWREVNKLIESLSMKDCNAELRALVSNSREPYRAILRLLRDKIKSARYLLEKKIKGDDLQLNPRAILSKEDLLEPLLICHRSLCECKGEAIANADLTDLIRRIYCFGPCLVKLDVRQDAVRHTQLINAITEYLGLGSYQQWSEEKKIEFLIKECESRRPLISSNMPLSDEDKEVLDTFKVIASIPGSSFGAYVISMAAEASDVLAVCLLQKEVNVPKPLRVVPLFETLDDLENCHKVMEQLFSIPWYRAHINDKQEVMIGYSDSGKDAGKFAAAWAQFQSQEKLVEVAKNHQVKLTLFHGRGGSVGRGGGPVHIALLSQPRDSVQGRMRVTEQGEVIQQKFGLTRLAFHNLNVYTTSVLEATLDGPLDPNKEWRVLMDEMSAYSVNAYRDVLRKNDKFLKYFHQVTPEKELGRLYIGSRPAKRKRQGDIESLRAIPWVFAWTQIRLMLPAWLGVPMAFQYALENDKVSLLRDMMHQWPFFYAFMDMLDMVLVKTDHRIVKIYDDYLASDDIKPVGKVLRERLAKTIELDKQLVEQSDLPEDRKKYRQSIHVRNTYADPINVIQAEAMRRYYHEELSDEDKEELADTLMVTIAGISAAMKNTG